MLISVADLEREPVQFKLDFVPGAIDYGAELEQVSPLAVEGRAELLEERHEDKTVVDDIRVRGSCAGEFQTPCARCLKPVHLPIAKEFDLIFRPLGADDDVEPAPRHGAGHAVRRGINHESGHEAKHSSGHKPEHRVEHGSAHGPSERSISSAETEIGYYQESGLLLEDVLREQVLLALPTRTLCRKDCKGLCPHCGRDLNTESCTCGSAPTDSRWTALSDLADRLKT